MMTTIYDRPHAAVVRGDGDLLAIEVRKGGMKRFVQIDPEIITCDGLEQSIDNAKKVVLIVNDMMENEEQ